MDTPQGRTRTALFHDGVSGEFVNDGPGSFVRITGVPETFYRVTSQRRHEQAFRELVSKYQETKAVWSRNHDRIEDAWSRRMALLGKPDFGKADQSEVDRIETEEIAPLLGGYEIGGYIGMRMRAWALDELAKSQEAERKQGGDFDHAER